MLKNNQDAYSQLLPTNPLHVLTRTFGMHPEQVFNTIRHCLKPLYELSTEECTAKVAEFKDVLDYYLTQNAKCINTECSDDYFKEKKYLEGQTEKVWNFITPELYMLFWYLQLSNIHWPIDKYKSVIAKVQAKEYGSESSDNKKKKKGRGDKQKKKSLAVLKEEK